MTKAFCVIDAESIDAVRHSSWRICTENFVPPPCVPGASLADGLLGRDGSALLRGLTHEAAGDLDLDDEGMEALVRLTEELTEFGQAVLHELLGEDTVPTFPILHCSEVRGGAACQPSSPKLLSDDEGSEWLQAFCRHRLMVLFFLGPGTGTLELGLYDDEALGVQRFCTRPGVMVVLRPEVLRRCHFAHFSKSSVVLSFFLLTLQTGPGPCEPQLPPYAEELLEWMQGRLRQTGRLSGEGRLAYIPSPADFAPQAGPEEPAVFSMDRPEKQARVLADACKLPSSWSSAAFFECVTVGADLVTEIPFMRFDYHEYTDMLQVHDAMGAIGTGHETLCKHGSFIEGVDLFDNLCFGVSADEVRILAPSIRSGLEVAHEAICKAEGTRAKTALENPRINADVLVGMHSEENELLRHSPATVTFKACAGCGGCRADDASRLSFALGLGGRSALFDTDGSSSFAALWQGFLDQTKEHGDRDDPVFSLVISSAWNLEPLCFASFCRRGFLSSAGRCFCFDVSASGFVRAEGCVGVVLARGSSFSTLSFDGVDEGSVRGVSIRQSGCAARLAEPAGVSMQQVMDEAVQAANVALADVNILEAHSPGAQLFDAMEMGAVERVFPRFTDDETLPVTDVKTVLGDGYAAGGLFALLKVLHGTQRATLGGSSFLKTLNRDIRMRQEECNLSFMTEALKHPIGSTGLTCVNSFGTKGTFVSAIVWADLNLSIPEAPFFPEYDLPMETPGPPAVSFWPAGGGELDPAEMPREGYYIVGSFSQWTDPQLMEEEAPGEFTATIMLGYNRWEQFQIWLDGDTQRVLHPGQLKASRKRAVFGPDPWEECQDFRWQVEGRQRKTLTRETGAGKEEQEEAEDILNTLDDIENEEAGWKWVDVPTRDAGEPGTMYKVCLRVAGKFRTVDWDRLPDGILDWAEDLDPVEVSRAMASIVDASSKPATYYVKANWSDWTCEQMTQDEADPNIWRFQVLLPYTNGVFTIVRNRDSEQYFYPEYDDEADPTKPILGPDDGNVGRCWMIREALGETLAIEFRREVGYRTDERRLRWWVAGQERLPPVPHDSPAVASTSRVHSASEAPSKSMVGLLLGPTVVPEPLGPAALPEELAAMELPEVPAEAEEAPRPVSSGVYVGPLTLDEAERTREAPSLLVQPAVSPEPLGPPQPAVSPQPPGPPQPPVSPQPSGLPQSIGPPRQFGAPQPLAPPRQFGAPRPLRRPASTQELEDPASPIPGSSAAPAELARAEYFDMAEADEPESSGSEMLGTSEPPSPIIGRSAAPAEPARAECSDIVEADEPDPSGAGSDTPAEPARAECSDMAEADELEPSGRQMPGTSDPPSLALGGSVAPVEPASVECLKMVEADEPELPAPRSAGAGPSAGPSWEAEPAVKRVEAEGSDPL